MWKNFSRVIIATTTGGVTLAMRHCTGNIEHVQTVIDKPTISISCQ
jgi:hypothetical protein